LLDELTQRQAMLKGTIETTESRWIALQEQLEA
jgi:hypothetical protein